MRPGVVLPGIEMGRLHNIFLQIITENGVLLLLIFFIFLYFSFYKLVNKIDSLHEKDALINKVLLSLVVGLVFVNLFEQLMYLFIYCIFMIGNH